MSEENPYGVPPFGAPMSDFIQTGNGPVTSPIVDDFSEKESIPAGEYNSAPTTNFPPFGGGQTNAPFMGTPPVQNQSNDKQKYQIVDLFWMLNPGMYSQPPKIIQGQAQFVVLSYNISFGNLRVSFFNLTNNSIQNNVVFLNNMQRTVSGTIYPASAYCIFNTPRISTVCLEQLFQSTGAEWQQNRPVCKVEKHESKIRLTIEDNKFGKFFYDFENWQREAFLYSCQFAFTTGMYLHGQNMIK